MKTQINQQFLSGTAAERLALDLARIPENYVFYETDTELAFIKIIVWLPFPGGLGEKIITVGFGALNSGGVSTQDSFLYVWNGPDPPDPIDEQFVRFSRSGKLGRIRVVSSTPPDMNCVVTLRIDGVDTAITATLLAGQTQADGNDVVMVDYAAGQRISCKVLHEADGTPADNIMVTAEILM